MTTITKKISNSIRRTLAAVAGPKRKLFAVSGVGAGLSDACGLYDLAIGGADGAATRMLTEAGLPASDSLASYRHVVDAFPASSLTPEQADGKLTAMYGKSWQSFFSLPLASHPSWAQGRIAQALLAARPQLERLGSSPESPTAASAQVRPAQKPTAPAVTASHAPAVRQPTGAEKSLREVNRQFDAGVAALRPAVAATTPEVTGADRVARDFNRQFSRNSKSNARP